VGGLVARGLAPATATRALATLRSLLAYAVADGRVTVNAAANVRAPSAGRTRREGRALIVAELRQLASACKGPYAELVLVLGLAGPSLLVFGSVIEFSCPVEAFVSSERSSPAVGVGELDVDSLKTNRARGISTLRVHDLRHTAASIWLAHGADPKVGQRVLGHATATMTMDLYGHLLDAGLWLAADKIGDCQVPVPGATDGFRLLGDTGVGGGWLGFAGSAVGGGEGPGFFGGVVPDWVHSDDHAVVGELD
jgi:hypothetical protein